MARFQEVQAVITANRERQKQARGLNIRAGAETFPVLDEFQLREWLSSHLNGAISPLDLEKPGALLLPGLDAQLVEKITRDNPDTIVVSGKTRLVMYQSNQAPQITIETGEWQTLPDEGVKLPGGRDVQVVCNLGSWVIFSEASVPRLKEKVKNHLNRKQWDSWSEGLRPVIILPNLNAENPIVPDIITAQYGTCVVEGTPLVAYGTAVVKDHRYYSYDPWFEAKWFQGRDEAEAANTQAKAKLGEIRVQSKEAEEREAAKVAAQQVLSQLVGLFSECYYNYDLDQALREKLYQRRYSILPVYAPGLRNWAIETTALLTEIKIAVAEDQKHKEQQALRTAEQEAQDRLELKPIFHALFGLKDVETARCIRDFGEEVRKQAATLVDAIHILDGQIKASYGHERQQQALRKLLPGLEATEAGGRFMRLYKAKDVNNYLFAGLAWLKSLPVNEQVNR